MNQYRVVSISRAVHYLIKLEAAKHRITMRTLVEEAVKEYIEKGKHD